MAGKFETHVEESSMMESIKICRSKTFKQRIFCSPLLHYLHVKMSVLVDMNLIDMYKFKWKVETKQK